MRNVVLVILSAATLGFSAHAQETQPAVRADVVTVEPALTPTTAPAATIQPAATPVSSPPPAPGPSRELEELRAENERLRVELQRVQNTQADAAQPTAPAPAVVHQYQSGAPVRNLAGGYVTIRDVDIDSSRKDGHPALKIETDVYFRNVQGLSFTLQAMVVDAAENVHTDPMGNPYIVARQISTDDQSDNEDYTVKLSLARLFSSEPPENVFVQVRIVQDGNIVAKSELYRFKRP